MIEKARELLESGTVTAVIGWQKGDLPYDAAPVLINAHQLHHGDVTDALHDMVYNGFCGSNLSKYLIQNVKQDGKTLIFLKPCDTYSLNQLLAEHRISRENIYIVGIGCNGMIDIDKIRAKGFKGILDISDDGNNLTMQTMYGDGTCQRSEVLLEKCMNCKGKEHMVYDELIGAELSIETACGDKFLQVAELEQMNSNGRYVFWRSQLSKCIRCNACRNACPACTCHKCIFDNPHSGVSAKVNVTDFEENLFHIIRAYHVAGRCSDCGECTRVCPQNVPLHLLNRKFIKDVNSFFGEFQAGETAELNSPLLHFDFQDPEPNIVSKRGDS